MSESVGGGQRLQALRHVNSVPSQREIEGVWRMLDYVLKISQDKYEPHQSLQTCSFRKVLCRFLIGEA